ncbi:uncharacterized protein LOC114266505 [Camellia sinensis]|uniref:uncharacterized protein LOC114266505 n=1 Tax=Camellia sinensis TaxID=4442 RepID=UPI0010363524|nr:uncharacterized protein LOC114266505 [Camellia sinensis]
MASQFPHGGGSPGAGGDPYIMSLPPRIRPFIPERYDPSMHILPRAVFYHFTDIDDRAPVDLLLREPESHLSYQEREVSSRITRGYGSIVARECYVELPEAVRDCTKQRCNFDIHKSGFELPQKIHHKSHPKHALTLLSSPSYKEYNEFTRNACREIGTGFTYHYKDCKFDLHVKCATLLETAKRKDHEHPLSLLYSSPYKKSEEDSSKDLIFYCDVCQISVDDSCWVYYCQDCDYGTDLHCVTAEKRPEEEETKEYSAEEAVAKAQQHMQLLQIQMEMSKQNAEFISGIAQSLSNLV